MANGISGVKCPWTRFAAESRPRGEGSKEMTERTQFGVDALQSGAVEEQSQSGFRPGLKRGRVAEGIENGGTNPIRREWRNEANWSSPAACQRVSFTTSSVARGGLGFGLSY